MKLIKTPALIAIFLLMASGVHASTNVIHKTGSCGFAHSGTNDYLVNTDRSSSYRVTVRIRTYHGIDSNQYDRVYIVAAGSKKFLGCTASSSIPVTEYNRSVVGEEKL